MAGGKHHNKASPHTSSHFTSHLSSSGPTSTDYSFMDRASTPATSSRAFSRSSTPSSSTRDGSMGPPAPGSRATPNYSEILPPPSIPSQSAAPSPAASKRTGRPPHSAPGIEAQSPAMETMIRRRKRPPMTDEERGAAISSFAFGDAAKELAKNSGPKESTVKQYQNNINAMRRFMDEYTAERAKHVDPDLAEWPDVAKALDSPPTPASANLLYLYTIWRTGSDTGDVLTTTARTIVGFPSIDITRAAYVWYWSQHGRRDEYWKFDEHKERWVGNPTYWVKYQDLHESLRRTHGREHETEQVGRVNLASFENVVKINPHLPECCEIN